MLKLTERDCKTLGCAGALLAVALGAFAAHGLKHLISAELLQVFQTAVYYQMIHSLALILLSLDWSLNRKNYPQKIAASAWFFLTGIILFSGSLYALSLTGVKSWGMVTPLGGVSFLLGWINWGYQSWRNSMSSSA